MNANETMAKIMSVLSGLKVSPTTRGIVEHCSTTAQLTTSIAKWVPADIGTVMASEIPQLFVALDAMRINTVVGEKPTMPVVSSHPNKNGGDYVRVAGMSGTNFTSMADAVIGIASMADWLATQIGGITECRNGKEGLVEVRLTQAPVNEWDRSGGRMTKTNTTMVDVNRLVVRRGVFGGSAFNPVSAAKMLTDSVSRLTDFAEEIRLAWGMEKATPKSAD